MGVSVPSATRPFASARAPVRLRRGVVRLAPRRRRRRRRDTDSDTDVDAGSDTDRIRMLTRTRTRVPMPIRLRTRTRGHGHGRRRRRGRRALLARGFQAPSGTEGYECAEGRGTIPSEERRRRPRVARSHRGGRRGVVTRSRHRRADELESVHSSQHCQTSFAHPGLSTTRSQQPWHSTHTRPEHSRKFQQVPPSESSQRSRAPGVLIVVGR